MIGTAPRILAIPLFTLFCVTSVGCVSVWHFEDLEARVAAVEGDVRFMQERQKEDQDRLTKLHQDMTEAEETLRLSGANLGDDVDRLKKDLARLQSTDEELQFALSKEASEIKAIRRALGERLGISMLDLPEGLVDNPDALVKAAQDAFAGGDDARASELAGIAAAKYPDSLAGARAIMLLGDIAMKAGSYATAAREYQRVYNNFKSVSGAPSNEALLKIGEALEKQANCKKAIEIYQFLIDGDKKSAEAKTAAERLKKLKKSCK